MFGCVSLSTFIFLQVLSTPWSSLGYSCQLLVYNYHCLCYVLCHLVCSCLCAWMNVSLFMYSCIQSLLCFRVFAALIKTSGHTNVTSTWLKTQIIRVQFLLNSPIYLGYFIYVIYGLPADRCHITVMENFLTLCHPSDALLAVFIFYREPRLCPTISG